MDSPMDSFMWKIAPPIVAGGLLITVVVLGAVLVIRIIELLGW